MMKVAIVILNWNGQQMLADYLGQVVEYSKDEAEIIVADNGSTDDSVEWVRTHFPEVRIIQLDRNYGFAEGYNKALVQVDYTYYVLLNSDVEVTPHWLTPLIEEMDARPEVAACQPKILSEVRKGSFEYAGACGGYIDRFGYPFCRGRIFDTVEEDHGQYDTPQEVLWASGCCLMIRADDYWSADGLDGRFFAHNEEIDLCWRLYQTGRKIFCFPQSTVYHVGGGTLPKGNPRKTFLNFRNNLTMLWKNLPEEDLRPVMLWRWLLDYVAAWWTLIGKRNLGDFKAIYRARRAFLAWRHDFDTDRCFASPEEKAKLPADGRKPYSILWQYHVKGKKHFSDLP